MSRQPLFRPLFRPLRTSHCASHALDRAAPVRHHGTDKQTDRARIPLRRPLESPAEARAPRTVDGMTLAQSERAALADLFDELGPDQPTLCEGWDTQDLLIHLVLRDGRPDAFAGTIVKPLQGWTDRVAAGYAKRPWSELVQRYRSGPPVWNPAGWGKLNELTNGGEMFIHHEDARRGQPGWEPRELDPASVAELEKMLGSGVSKLALRKFPVGVVAELPGGRHIPLKSGEPTATVTGEPGEIVLWLSGRDAAKVTFTGDDQAVSGVQAGSRGV